MTIATGFTSRGGIVLGCDSEETTGSVKIPKEKMTLYSKDVHQGKVRAAIVGAGDAVFCDMISAELWKEITLAEGNIDSILAALKEKLIKIHAKYHKFSEDAVQYEVDALIALSVPDHHPRLFHAQGPAVAEVDDYRCIGYGLELGNYILARMWDFGRTIDQATVVAAYLLQQVKTYVRFCGGKSHIVTMTTDGAVSRVHRLEEAGILGFLAEYEQFVANAMVVLGNAKSNEDDIQMAGAQLVHLLLTYRKEMQESADEKIANLHSVMEQIRKMQK